MYNTIVNNNSAPFSCQLENKFLALMTRGSSIIIIDNAMNTHTADESEELDGSTSVVTSSS